MGNKRVFETKTFDRARRTTGSGQERLHALARRKGTCRCAHLPCRAAKERLRFGLSESAVVEAALAIADGLQRQSIPKLEQLVAHGILKEICSDEEYGRRGADAS